MNWLDAFIFCVAILWSMNRSRRGLLRVGVEFGSTALGLWAAVRFTSAVASVMAGSWGVPTMVGGPGIFIALALLPTMVGQAVSQRLAAARPEHRAVGADRIAGGLLGIVEVAVIVGILLVAFAKRGGQLFAPPLIDSVVVGWLLRFVPGLYSWAAEVLTP